MSYDYEKKQQIQAKTKISLEKWEKKVMKPFKPYFFLRKFIYDPLDVFTKGSCSHQYWDDVIRFQNEPIKRNVQKNFKKI